MSQSPSPVRPSYIPRGATAHNLSETDDGDINSDRNVQALPPAKKVTAQSSGPAPSEEAEIAKEEVSTFRAEMEHIQDQESSPQVQVSDESKDASKKEALIEQAVHGIVDAR